MSPSWWIFTVILPSVTGAIDKGHLGCQWHTAYLFGRLCGTLLFFGGLWLLAAVFTVSFWHCLPWPLGFIDTVYVLDLPTVLDWIG